MPTVDEFLDAKPSVADHFLDRGNADSFLDYNPSKAFEDAQFVPRTEPAPKASLSPVYSETPSEPSPADTFLNNTEAAMLGRPPITQEEATAANKEGWKAAKGAVLDPLISVGKHLGITPQQITDAIDTLGATGYLSEQAHAGVAPDATFEELAGQQSRKPGDIAKIAAGSQQAVVESLDFFTSPLGILTLGSGALPKLAQRGIALAFVTDMAHKAPDQLQQFLESKYAGDKEGMAKGLSGMGLTGAFIIGGATHGVKGLPGEIAGRAKEAVGRAVVKTLPDTPRRFMEPTEEIPALITRLEETDPLTAEAIKGGIDAKPPKADATTTDQVGAEISATEKLESTKAAEEITSEPIPGEQKIPSTSPAAEAPVAGDASPPSTVKPSETPPMAEPTITGETPSAEVKTEAGKFENKGVGSPADEYGAIYGPKLSPNQTAKYAEQVGHEFPLASPEGTTTVLKVKPSMLWVETDRPVGGLEHEVGVAYLKIRHDGTTVLDASHHGRPIDKLAAKQLMDFLQKSQPEKQVTPTPQKQLAITPPAASAEVASPAPASPAKVEPTATGEIMVRATGKTPVQEPSQEPTLPQSSSSKPNPPSWLNAREKKAFDRIHQSISTIKEYAPREVERESRARRKGIENADIAMRRAAEILGVDMPRRSTFYSPSQDLANALRVEKEMSDLFNEATQKVKPTPPGGKGEAVPPQRPDVLSEGAKDWTSATEESPGDFPTPGPTELHSGIAVPKFGNRKMSPLDKVTTTHSAKLQKSFDEARRAQNAIRKAIPNPKRREASSIYREAGGDMTLLKTWETNAKQKWMKDAARDAQTLTPEEIAIVDKAKTAFEVLEKRGNNFDVLKSHRDNYIPHVWNIKKPGHGFGVSMLKERFKFSKARTLNTFFEGDQAGMKKPNLDLANLLPAYIHEMNTVIADRQMVRDIVKGQMPDGSPMAVEKGNVSTVEGDSGKAVLVKPKSAREADTSDYKVMADQPALSNWIWEGKDTDGKPVFVKADLGLHPDVLRRVNAMIGQSAFRSWYHDPVSGAAQIPRAIVRGLDTAQAVMKREMFGLLAPFHQVQEGTHGIGHMVNPFFGLEKIDLRKPNQLDAANHGLMLLPDRASSRVYLEGVGTQTSLLSRGIRKVPKVGEAISDVIDGYQDYLFHQYIPALKLKTYEAMLGRNTKLYAEEFKSGEMTEADIKITSAEQANAAYGHLNYALLDRNPTIQHIIQLGALAPDFLEARTRFAGQAVKGLSSKVGHEQLKAIAILAAAQAGSAFILSNLLGTDYDPKHPFEVIYNGRRYFLRSVPEDIYAFLKDRRQFIAGRVNPLIVKGGIQLLEGVNYRGEKVDTLETFTELLAGYIPLTARSLPGVRSLTETSRNNPISPLQQLAGSFGLRISRYSPISETYKNASAWMEGKKLPKDRGSYPISKYQQLRYALEDGDLDRAKGEYEELKKTMTPSKISSGFRSSINHPFTGSLAGDREFAASLKGYDKELYDHAIATRKNILNAFGKIGDGGSLSLDLLPK